MLPCNLPNLRSLVSSADESMAAIDPTFGVQVLRTGNVQYLPTSRRAIGGLQAPTRMVQFSPTHPPGHLPLSQNFLTADSYPPGLISSLSDYVTYRLGL